LGKNFIYKGAVMKLRHKGIALGCCLALVLVFFASPLLAAEKEPTVGQVIGPVKFAAPLTAAGAKYLGLAKQAPFTIKDVKSPYILIEQFNTTCPHCMHQAPILNQLYTLVQKDSGLAAKVKFISVGQSNDDSAVKMWKAFNKVPFPVIADPNASLGKAINFSPYPVSMLVNKSGKIVWVHIGAFDDANEALKGIKAAAK
jgi:thiol-disulfide isomerase/thioredoxin